MSNPWIGVDLDGTLAFYDEWRGENHIGEPIPLMLKRVQTWVERDIEVRIVTARATRPESIPVIQAWLQSHGLPALKVTCCKDFDMVELWDDRAVHVGKNTGIPSVQSWYDPCPDLN